MKDFSEYPRSQVLFSGAERKFEITIKGYKYIVKFQKNSEIGLTYNHISEYLGAIFSSLSAFRYRRLFLEPVMGKM